MTPPSSVILIYSTPRISLFFESPPPPLKTVYQTAKQTNKTKQTKQKNQFLGERGRGWNRYSICILAARVR